MDKYKIYCESEGLWHEVIASATPTVCPADSGHILRIGSAVIIAADVHELDGSYTELSLEDLKCLRYRAIDNRTGELVGLGFEFPPTSGLRFSLSQNAQINISALHQSKDDPALTYPITYNTIDDLGSYLVPNAATLHNMYLTALATKKTHIDSGTALKNEVRDAVNAEEVNLIIDNR